MFRQLKWRFVVLIMSLLTLVFVGIFGAIYGMTDASLNRQARFSLEKLMRGPAVLMPDSREAFGAILLEMDAQGGILGLQTYMEVDPHALETSASKLLAKAQSQRQMFGRAKIDSVSYDYLISTTPVGYKIVFFDRTPANNTLINLARIFMWVGGGSLLALFGVSLFFARRAVAPIQAAFDKQQQFVADASHELRTPLTVIQTQLALLEKPSDSQQARWIEGIKTQTTIMAALITDMLDLAKLDHGLALRQEETEFRDLVSDCLITYEAIFFERGMTLETQIDPRPITLKVEPDSLRRLLVILLDNAVKYTPKGGWVRVKLVQEKQKVILSLRNSGEGIPEDLLETIFDRFVRLDPSRTKESGGYGLGLPIARAIAQQHGGRLNAASRLGEWTEMTLTLPLHKKS